jgi:hypothetical protein
VDQAVEQLVTKLDSQRYPDPSPEVPKWAGCRDEVVGQFSSAFVELIVDFGAPESVQRGCRNSIVAFLTVDDELTYWSRAKNLVCFFKARYLKNPEPDVTGYVFGGAWKHWAKSRMHFNRKNTSLWASTFKIKNAAARLSERAAVATMHKHAKSVSRTFESDPRPIEQCVRSIQPLLEEAAKKIADDYYSGRWEDPGAASNSACFESSRTNFGQIGHFMERVFGPDSPVVCPGVNFCGFGPQIRSGTVPCSLPKEVQRRKEMPEKALEKHLEEGDLFSAGICQERIQELAEDFPEGSAYDYDLYERRLDYVSREETPAVKRVTFYEEVTVDGVRYSNSWFETFFFPEAEKFWMNEIMIDALRACSRDEALAKVACVLEPFKVRIITKGEAALQYMSSAFQKSAFEFNKTVPCFRLVGKAPTATDLMDLRENAKPVVYDPHWASSDFSGASDGTAGHYRDCIMDCLIQFLPLHVQSIIRSCNGDHVVSYPGPLLYPSMLELGKVNPVTQTLGTLMGEKTSFIILCYEVLGAHVSNRRRCGDRRSLGQILKGVLINGDDRLAISNTETEREFWSFCEKHLGFTESKGKSYLHSKYANINSQSYLYDLSDPKSTPWKVPVRASGLEHGQKKLDEPFDPSVVITQILDGCYDSRMEWAVLQRFFSRHRGRLEECSAGRNLFVHQSLGGMGNRLPLNHPRRKCTPNCHHTWGQGWRVAVTLDQLEVADALLHDRCGFVLPYGPSPMLEVELPQLLETPWDVYGKPTYWNQEEFELKEMGHYYRRQIASFSERGSSSVTERVQSFRRAPLTGSEILSSRLRVLRNSGTSVQSVETWKRLVWRCQVCSELNDESLYSCECCLLPRERLREMANGFVVVSGKASVDEELVVEREPAPICNVSLSRSRLERLGYCPDPLDEFDVALYDHAIESARVDEGPTVRYRGRAVDLFGEDLSWAPLRPATLVW